MELPQSAKEYTFQLHTQTEKLSFLITSLVKLSRLETGIVTLHPENGSISQLAEEVAASYMEKAAAKGLKLSVQPAEDCQGVFDRKWTAEALGNIIDNGIKYTNSGSVIVSVKRYEMFVCIEISDTGIGIQEQEMSQVFTRFYRGKDTQEQEGVGIGLYLAGKSSWRRAAISRSTQQKEKARYSPYSCHLQSRMHRSASETANEILQNCYDLFHAGNNVERLF